MRLNVSEKDFPTAGKFVYLNAANVALMYGGAQQVMREWQEDVAWNGSNNFNEKLKIIWKTQYYFHIEIKVKIEMYKKYESCGKGY